MSLPVYPGPSLLPGLAYSSKWTPRFFVQTVATTTGAEIDIGIAQYPLHDFELTYKFLRDGPGWGGALSALEFRTMMGFFLQMQGSLGRFLYSNPDDNAVAAQAIGTGNGATTAFTLVRTFGAGGFGASETVGQVDTTQAFNVYLDGMVQAPTSYTLSTASPHANTVTFASAPASGAAVTVDMTYFYYVKFAKAAQDFDKFMNHIWSVGKLTLRGCRLGA